MPPHWKLVFQIPQARFGMDPGPVQSAAETSDAARYEAFCSFHLDVAERLIEECDWAAAPPRNAGSAVAIIATRKRVGDHALVPDYEGGGGFWMPSGTDMLDFAVRLFEQPDDLRAEARRKCDAAKEQVKRQVAVLSGAGVTSRSRVRFAPVQATHVRIDFGRNTAKRGLRLVEVGVVGE